MRAKFNGEPRLGRSTSGSEISLDSVRPGRRGRPAANRLRREHRDCRRVQQRARALCFVVLVDRVLEARKSTGQATPQVGVELVRARLAMHACSKGCRPAAQDENGEALVELIFDYVAR